MTARHLTPYAQWSDNWAVGYAVPFPWVPIAAANDNEAKDNMAAAASLVPEVAASVVISAERDGIFVSVDGDDHPGSGTMRVFERHDVAGALGHAQSLAFQYGLAIDDCTGADDSFDPSIVLATHADRIIVSVLGDEYLTMQLVQAFEPDEVERADWYAYALANQLGMSVHFYFAPEVRNHD